MINSLLLIFDSSATWDKIAKANRGVAGVFILHLLPLLVISLGIEAYALIHLGEARGLTDHMRKIPQPIVMNYALIYFVLLLGIVFLGAKILQKIGESFHSTHNYRQCFVTLAYSLSPLFLARILDAWPAMNTWVCWGLGAILSVAVMYQGLPRLMNPDQTNALGIYLVSSVLVLIVTGAAHYVAVLVLQGKIQFNI